LGNEIGEAYCGGSLTKPEQLTRYVSQVLEGLATGDFLYLAHPDLAGYRFPQEHIQTEYRRLCEGAKALKIPLEINLLGLLTGRHYPNETLFKIAAEVGNDVVIGVDAHDPQYLNDRALEQKGLDMATSLGLNLITKPLLQ
jgi:histidinol-phosphatase (PHP family)